MDFFIKDIRHFGIVVKNMPNSLRFYRDLLRLDVVSKMDCYGSYVDTMLKLKNVRIDIVKLSANNGTTQIELLEYKSPPQESTHREINYLGPSHIAFTVNNLDECYRFLMSKKIRFNSTPQISFDGKVKICFCYDPDNNPIELVEILSK